MSLIIKCLIINLVPAICAYSSVTQADVNSPTAAETLIYCICPFSNNTGEKQYDLLAEGFCDILSADLTRNPEIRVVERERLVELLKEQKISARGSTEPLTAVKIGKLLKADRILIGGFTKVQSNYLINAHVYEIATARLIGSVQSRSDCEDILKTVDDLATKLFKMMQLELAPLDSNDIDGNVRVSDCFIRGLGFYYTGNIDAALVEFMKAQDSDDNSDKAVYWTGMCFMKNKEYKHAILEFQNILKKFPESSYCKIAKQSIIDCNNPVSTQ